MNWTAHPKVRTSDIDHFKKSKSNVKNLNFGELSKNEEIKRALFNLAFYSSKVKDAKKKEALLSLLRNLSETPENADTIIATALEDKALIKNTKFGFYKFFHSEFKNEVKGDRWARSTTEHLLIEAHHTLKNSIVSSIEEESQESSKKHL